MKMSKIFLVISLLTTTALVFSWQDLRDVYWTSLSDYFNALPSPTAGINTPEPKTTDVKAYNAFPRDAAAVITPGMPPAGNSLLGRNYLWNGMYSPRWQQTSGKALRTMLAAGRSADARRAFLAIKVGTDAIAADGKVPFLLPSSLQGYAVTPSMVAQAASFFLGESCLAIKAFSQYPASFNTLVASAAELAQVREALARGLDWLLTQDSILFTADAISANRLLFDAVTYQACGSLLDNLPAIDLVDSYLAKVITIFDSRGYFIERSGWDTHYQAVAINQGNDLLLAGYNGTYADNLKDDLALAAAWLLARVDANGVVHSAGNTRICWSGETILGGEKMLDPRETWRALLYSGLRLNDAALQNAAARVAIWFRSKPATTCVQ
ncbi:hypothetical protein ACH50O_14920 [Methylomonas sp. 2BW1-5-20]|uniref:hypothetical protein n=1 Tax=Methylomonas sp. 2BW1-5-20 TaxID=3376686 RepID=UPI0040511B8E